MVLQSYIQGWLVVGAPWLVNYSAVKPSSTSQLRAHCFFGLRRSCKAQLFVRRILLARRQGPLFLPNLTEARR